MYYLQSANIEVSVIRPRVLLCNSSLTLYSPQTIRQVVLAVHRLVAGGDVAEVAGLLHAVGWREGLEGKEAVVAVHFRWYVCQQHRPCFLKKTEMHGQKRF